MKTRFTFFLVPITLLLSIPSFAKTKAGHTYRLGAGIGYSYYLGDQMDYKITSNFGNFNENRSAQSIAFYKAINSNWELGGFARNASIMTLKSENTQGLECFFQDIQFTAQYSFNDNVDLSNSGITFNGTLGLGLINLKSRYFGVNPITETEVTNYATIGYGYADGYLGTKNAPDKVTAVTGHAGLNIGLRVSENIRIYLENNFNLTTTNKLSGNLYKYSWIPTDGYWYSGVALYIGFGGKTDACPRFY
ncbi:MAG: hypothetical protein ACOVO9_14440 [Bacteroidia bacterium]